MHNYYLIYRHRTGIIPTSGVCIGGLVTVAEDERYMWPDDEARCRFEPGGGEEISAVQVCLWKDRMRAWLWDQAWERATARFVERMETPTRKD